MNKRQKGLFALTGVCLLSGCGFFAAKINKVFFDSPPPTAMVSNQSVTIVASAVPEPGPLFQNNSVTFSVVSGGGSLSGKVRNAKGLDSVVYTAPQVTANTSVVIRATSEQDRSVSADVSVQITP